jgi:hypothetical protein
LLGGRESSQQTSSLKEVNEYFHQAGYALVKDFAQMPFLHTLHMAIFEYKT